MTDHQALRDHLQWFLVGSLHYSYIDAGAKAISLVVAGRGENLVETPEREILSAAELVEEWSLGRVRRSGGRPA